MQQASLSIRVVEAVIQHLFDPDPTSKARASVRGLTSPHFVLDFPTLGPPHKHLHPFLVPLSEKRAARAPNARPQEPHSVATQRLALLRFPAWLVNSVLPGSEWGLKVRSVRPLVLYASSNAWKRRSVEAEQFEGATQWEASLVWTLPFTPIPWILPEAWANRFALEYVTRRQGYLFFNETNEEEYRDRKVAYLSTDEALREGSRAAMHRQEPDTPCTRRAPDMQLTHVCYWVPGSSAAFLAPCIKYNWILCSLFKLLCPIPKFVVAMLHGLLLLVGLDYSTRSLSSSIETRKRDQKNRKLRALHRDLGYSPTAPSSPMDQPAFNTASAPFRIYEWDSDDGSDHISTYALSADLKVATEVKWNNELMYHRVMRRTHASLRLLGQGLHGLRILGRALTSEARMIAWTIRRMVVFFLGGLMITAETGTYTRGQVGLDWGLPFDPNDGSRPDEIRRHSKAKIHETRQQMLHESPAGFVHPSRSSKHS